METAGVMDQNCSNLLNNVPCLVIRGITKSSDEHKNVNWQSSGAAAAAAHVKDILDGTQPNTTRELRRDIVSNMLLRKEAISGAPPVNLYDGVSNGERSEISSLSQNTEEDDSIKRSMAGGKLSASDAELAPKRCREPGCDKGFKRLSDLLKHENTHSRPWKCPVESCKYHDYGWPTEKEMDRHYNDKHSANPPLYECHFENCPYRSKRKSNVKQHMEKAHGWEYVRSKNGEMNWKAHLYKDMMTHDSLVNLQLQGLREEISKSDPEALTRWRESREIFSSFEEPNQAMTKDVRMKTSPEKEPKEPQAFGGQQAICHKGLDNVKNSTLCPIGKVNKASGDRYCRDQKPRENRRKVLPILIKKRQHLACPDSGSAKNIMSESFARECNLKIRRRPKDIKTFELGNGKYIPSIGRVSVSVQLPGHVFDCRKHWFYVFATCPVPVILGMPYLDEAEIFTRNRHLLETCPPELGRISTLLWIASPRQKSHESPRNRFMCSLDRHKLEAVADTGSDLNLMSLHCAKREGFRIDRRREARIRIQVGNATEAETVGQVQVHSFSLNWREAPTLEDTSQSDHAPGALQHDEKEDDEDNDEIIFHVLPGLPCDVIFGRELLEQADIFKSCFNSTQNSLMPKRNAFEFRIYISLGRIANALPIPRRRRRKRAPIAADEKEAHDDSRHAEMYRRTKQEEEIACLPVEQQSMARDIEERRITAWKAAHRTCRYCQPG